MQCPFCKVDETRVVDSRAVKDTNAIRRRRACDKCDRRFTTYERFDREKIRRGVQLAFKKLPIGSSQIDAVVDAVERHFADSPEREVSAAAVGEVVMARLREVDQVAYVRFASVYRQFRDVNEFMSELSQLVADPTRGER
jgi:transcriptional repressor NrdR